MYPQLVTTKSGCSSQILADYANAQQDVVEAAQRFREIAVSVADGPLNEQENRAAPYIALGRELAKRGGQGTNHVVLRRLRLFGRDGKFEPVKKAIKARDGGMYMTPEEIWELSKRLLEYADEKQLTLPDKERADGA